MKKPKTFKDKLQIIIKEEIKKEKKKSKHKAFKFKVKVFLITVFPTVTALLAAAAARVFLRIKLRETAADPEISDVIPQPVTLESSRPEFITPEPVDTVH